jgi:FixJ family two-component response regulator
MAPSAVLLDRPDVIVSDLELHAMSGQELVKAFRDFAVQTPLIAVSGTGLEVEVPK